MTKIILGFFIATMFAICPVAFANKTGEASVAAFTGHIVEPRKEKLEDITTLTVQDGFKISVFAKDLINPRMMALGENGRVYVTRRSVGDVVMLHDRDDDGQSDEMKIVANQPAIHGIAIDGKDVFIVTVKEVYTAQLQADGSFTPLKKIIDDLPDGGQHPNRTIGVGPDSKLYISVGSTCNACAETTPEAATILIASRDGKSRKIYSSGLRNTIGFAWHPITRALWGMDHNVDWHGDDNPPEELNELQAGSKYGWPYVLGPTFLNPQDDPPGDITLEQWRDSSVAPALTYTAHAAPMQMAFHSGVGMPSGYAGNAFVAMRGSWNRSTPSGYEIVRIIFDDSGKPTSMEPWITGFLTTQGEEHVRTARPAGVLVANDGAVLFTDDENGIVYRVTSETAESADDTVASPPSLKSTEPVKTFKLAIDEFKTSSVLIVKSSSFESAAYIPKRFSDYGDKLSPSLEWSKGPQGTQSYVVIVDDPDAKPASFNHWTVYNLSSDTTKLFEGFPTDASVKAPIAAQQGANTRGSSGYFGPRPPAGDPAHRYHFQVFALDKMLDLPPGPNRSQLVAAMQGHVLASGVLIGTFKRSSDVQSTADDARNIRRE